MTTANPRVDLEQIDKYLLYRGPVDIETALEELDDEGVWAEDYGVEKLREMKKADIRHRAEKKNPDTGLPVCASIMNDDGTQEYIHTQNALFRASDFYSTKWRDYYRGQAIAYARKAAKIEHLYGLEQLSMDFEWVRDEVDEDLD